MSDRMYLESITHRIAHRKLCRDINEVNLYIDSKASLNPVLIATIDVPDGILLILQIDIEQEQQNNTNWSF